MILKIYLSMIITIMFGTKNLMIKLGDKTPFIAPLEFDEE